MPFTEYVHFVLYNLFYLILKVYIVLRTYTALAWLRFNKYIRFIPKVSKYHKTLLILGDGYAEGFGDWVTYSHIAGIPVYFAKEMKQGNHLLLWTIISEGKYQTTSKDWLPNSEKKSLWEQVFSNPNNISAEVVLVLVGSYDFTEELESIDERSIILTDHEVELMAQKSVDNIGLIVKSLDEMGKMVVVSSTALLQSYQSNTNANKVQKKLNQLLQTYFIANYKDSKNIEYHDLLQKTLFVDAKDARSKYLAFDYVHLNSTGYKQLAKITYLRIATLLRRCEFKSLTHADK